jgi:hypothetical protein
MMAVSSCRIRKAEMWVAGAEVRVAVCARREGGRRDVRRVRAEAEVELEEGGEVVVVVVDVDVVDGLEVE